MVNYCHLVDWSLSVTHAKSKADIFFFSFFLHEKVTHSPSFPPSLMHSALLGHTRAPPSRLALKYRYIMSAMPGLMGLL